MMSAKIIDGKQIASQVLDRCRKEVSAMQERHGKTPCLAVVLVGDDPASHIYVRNKIRSCQSIGMLSQKYHLPADTEETTIHKHIQKLNQDKDVHGILVQLPLPAHLARNKVVAAVHPEKDVDGLHPNNVSALYLNEPSGLVPCTAKGCMLLLQSVLDKLEGLHAVIVGRSNLVGKPLAHLLLRANCSVSILHSRSQQPAALAATADILIGAVGVPRLVTAEWIKPGAVLIDVGINKDPDKNAGNALCGDIDYPNALEIASAITPVPGGVGPMTVACLMENCIQAFKHQNGYD